MTPPTQTTLTAPAGTASTASAGSTATAGRSPGRARAGGKPILLPPRSRLKLQGERVALALFVAIPFAAVIAAVPMLWGRYISLTDVIIAIVMYYLTGHGVTVGFHRYFTHGSFKAKRWMRVALAVAGSMAVEGPIIRWVADHRRHHAFSDREGDPHSPWRYGESLAGLTKGFWHAHLGWMFEEEQTNQERFAPDLIADKDIALVSRSFGALTAVSLLLPALAGGLITWSWTGALTAFFWGSLVRVFILHHTTWSVNSICHIVGKRPFASRDKSANFWPMALLAMGENWHNLHHADPTSARHGVLRGQVDTSARIIWLFEKLGWIYDVRWPSRERLAAKMAA
jgi:stearoyl-CoA desaturase (delta-9 desaturase)